MQDAWGEIRLRRGSTCRYRNRAMMPEIWDEEIQMLMSLPTHIALRWKMWRLVAQPCQDAECADRLSLREPQSLCVHGGCVSSDVPERSEADAATAQAP